MNHKHKHILLGISGGIAAYKAAELVRLLRKSGALVKVVMTESAQQFITPMTLQALSGEEVRTSLFDSQAEMGMSHIELARWADVFVIAPASAATIARLAHGYANDLLSTLYLATEAPVMIFPAMNQRMWLHTATQSNLAQLKERGHKILGPAVGSQACGDEGPGRMLEPVEIFSAIEMEYVKGKHLEQKKVLITAGPTQERIDPVRYIANDSSGKMGYALAEAAIAQGAQVTLVTGPTQLASPAQAECIKVTTAKEMYDAVMNVAQQHDIFIGAAAVGDYYCVNASEQKQAKAAATDELTLLLKKNPDILATVAELEKNRPFTVGFAAQTHDVIEYAKQKRERKNINMIIANHVNQTGKGFNSDFNELDVIWAEGSKKLGYNTKTFLAKQLIEIIAKHYETYHST